jgi:lysozyme
MKRISQISFFILLLLSSQLTSQQKTTAVGTSLIKYYEGFQSRAYLCPAGILTIGFGHTGSDVYPGMIITKKQGELILRNDLNRFENYVDETVERSMRWHEFDAVTSFTFNVGYRVGNELKQALDAGNIKMVKMILMKYCKAKVNGRLITLPGLLQRRKSECALYDNTYSKVWSKLLLSL